MLSCRIQEMRAGTRSGSYHRFRTSTIDIPAIESECAHLSSCGAKAKAFQLVLAAETPVIIPGERLQFTRTLGKIIPQISSEQEQRETFILPLENLSPDYELLLSQGVDGRISAIEAKLADPALTDDSRDFLIAAKQELETVLAFAERYAAAAQKAGLPALAELCSRVPRHPAGTLQEALQSIYFISAMLRLSAAIHCGFARMDQYLLPFYRNDLSSGRETAESARDLIAEFFLMLNRDNDLFVGVQPGDNGQSLMLGGCHRDGTPAENELTLVMLDVSADLAMIEPKINLRISSHTSPDCLRAAARLSGCGLGFPQYCNDDVIIPGLTAFGYPLEDARDYTVAACWEFVVKNGRDVPNLYSLNLALAADRAIRAGLQNHENFEQIKARIPDEIRHLLQVEQQRCAAIYFSPNPLFSAFYGNSLEDGCDLNVAGGSHRHYGCHGCGSSTAADSLAAVKHFVFDEKSVTAEELLTALEQNFAHAEALQLKLRTEGPHVGCGSSAADDCLCFIFNTFADVLEEVEDNGRGGRIRPGTGSAMNYVIMTQYNGVQRLGATADGRRDGEYISSSLAPAPGVTASGILSVLQSYGKLDYRRLCNGGPITLEVDPGYFQSSQALKKWRNCFVFFYAPAVNSCS